MSKQTKILIGIFVAVAILVGAFFLYNKLLISEKPTAPKETIPQKPKEPISPTEKISPKLSFSIPQKLEVPAYKTSSFNFSIENEKGYPEAKDVNIKVYPKDDDRIQYEISRRISKGEERMSPLEAQFDNFIRCIKGEAKPTVDGDFATKSVALIEEMYKHKTLMQEPWVIKDLIS